VNDFQRAPSFVDRARYTATAQHFAGFEQADASLITSLQEYRQYLLLGLMLRESGAAASRAAINEEAARRRESRADAMIEPSKRPAMIAH